MKMYRRPFIKANACSQVRFLDLRKLKRGLTLHPVEPPRLKCANREYSDQSAHPLMQIRVLPDCTCHVVVFHGGHSYFQV